MESKDMNTRAILSFIFSILGIFIFKFIFGVIGVWTGCTARDKIDKEKENGLGLAKAGIIIGWFDIITWFIAIFLFILLAMSGTTNY